MSTSIRFFFDFISPYAYLGWTQIHGLAARYGREVDASPILFAALLDAYGTKGPAEIPPKRVYIWKDVLRTARVLGVRVTPPPGHPFNPLLALRVVSLIEERGARKSAIDALFAATWGGGYAGQHGVTEPEAVLRVLDAAGLDGKALVERTATEEAKTNVRKGTQAALEAGVFGVPTLHVDGEIFWGVDSFAHAERRLQGFDPIEGVDLAQWAELPAQARRKGG